MSFARELELFKNGTLQKFSTVRRLSAFDLFSAIILETPVDKGVLRNNWFAEIGKGSNKKTTKADKSGSGTIAAVDSKLKKATIYKDIFLTNNLPYAIPIEFDGHSGKAPQGMVRVNTARWNTIVKANIARLKRGG